MNQIAKPATTPPSAQAEPVQTATHALVVTADPLPVLRDVAKVWEELAQRAEGSFFTTWVWIGAWLTTLAAHGFPMHRLRLLKATKGPQVCGLAIIAPVPRSPRQLWRAAYLLNQAGVPAFDAPYIEYNDVLVADHDAADVRRAMLDVLCRRTALRVQAGTDALAAAIVDIAPGAAITRRDRCDYLDLRQLQPADTPLDAILAALSRNTRQQARRALRLAERAGPLTLTRATSPGQAEAFLAELMRLHGEAWQARKGKAGAFATPFMREFIAALVAAGVRAGTVDVVKVADPERTIGVLLNFVHRGGAYAYQSGFAYSADNRDKPGLVCHLLAAADAHSRGLSGYHFMGGESRYKSSLSNAVETLSWIETHRSAVVARTEYAARALWRRFKRT